MLTRIIFFVNQTNYDFSTLALGLGYTETIRDQVIEELKRRVLMTKKDFEDDSSMDSSIYNMVNLAKDDLPDEDLKLHHDVLLKLKEDIARGNHWIENYQNKS